MVLLSAAILQALSIDRWFTMVYLIIYRVLHMYIYAVSRSRSYLLYMHFE